MGVGICIQTSIEEIGREVSLKTTALPRTLTDINYIQSLQHSASQRSAIVSCLSRG
ncbi:hypothetical protein L873DRAFT_1812365 [Choiromyces venosus 120613-1]|uniref:Uncharacterized protein n=1 Tax=Choiromyces venosus 120613-1 TaxID=1336337 RepID=A0A3N4JEV0_9PEZI|nr:hypothetical protein L873DRAFT_1812365 [Choiromyces venosus 120613-1]